MENRSVAEEDTKEFWKWKSLRLSESNSQKNQELFAIMDQLKTENRDLTQATLTQAAQLTRLQAELEDCKSKCESAEKRCESAENLGEIYRQKFLETKGEFAKVKSAYEKDLAGKHEAYRNDLTRLEVLKKFKVAQVNTELKNERAQRESKQSELSQRLQEAQESASRTIRERDGTIAELRKSNKEKLEELQQARVKHLRDLAATRQSVEFEYESQIAKLNDNMEDLKNKLKEQKSKLVQKNVKINTLDKQKQDLTMTVQGKDEHLRIQANEKKQTQQQLNGEELLGTQLEVRLKTLTEAKEKLEQESRELKEQQERNKTQLLTLKDENNDLNRKVQTLKQKLLSVQPVLRQERDKCEAMAKKNRDFVAGLDGCREVLAEPRKLKAKVVALIAAHVEGNANVHVDRDAHNLNVMMSNTIRELVQRHDRIVSHHKRETEHARGAAKNAEVRADREKMALVTYINKQRMESMKTPVRK
uniref:Uncharacterized protein n=1 Tax=Knipowitschia caucasica TaxID=637954 RepID=A0AAV2KNL8_KNICA